VVNYHSDQERQIPDERQSEWRPMDGASRSSLDCGRVRRNGWIAHHRITFNVTSYRASGVYQVWRADSGEPWYALQRIANHSPAEMIHT